jgi:DNA-binding NtrC family response regulator
MNSKPSIIIVAEDELLIRMMAAEALTSAGFHVVEVEHADAALTILRSRAGDVCALFTDVNMPGDMNGLHLAHHAAGHWPWIRLLVASGHAQLTETDLPDGCRFLPKPYDPEHMVGHIRDLTMAV